MMFQLFLKRFHTTEMVKAHEEQSGTDDLFCSQARANVHKNGIAFYMSLWKKKMIIKRCGSHIRNSRFFKVFDFSDSSGVH